MREAKEKLKSEGFENTYSNVTWLPIIIKSSSQEMLTWEKLRQLVAGTRQPVDYTRREFRNRRDLLLQVREEVDGRLAQSLHNKVSIILHKEEQGKQVQRPWDVEIKTGNQPGKQLF